MTRLHELYDDQGQSPWIDNLNRPSLRDGGLGELVAQGIRGVTSNPTIFEKAMTGSDAYDEQFRSFLDKPSFDRGDVENAFWDMAIDDVAEACGVLRGVYDASAGKDGFVSLEVAPELANETAGTITAARSLHQRIELPNLMVKIPGTEAGVPAVGQMISEGRNINVTLIFSVERYAAVIEAYLAGLEAFAASGGELRHVHSVASFFVSRVDTEVDRRIEQLASPAADLGGKAAVAQAKTAYNLYQQQFSGPRWESLAAQGAHPQRPLWASTSTKNPAYPDLLYVNGLIGPDTVNTMPDATVKAFAEHGTVARTVDQGVERAESDLQALAEAGVDMADVALRLEEEGVTSFTKSFEDLLSSLSDKASRLHADS
ncbi:MAG: transaldolase [Actinomycetota bacterium]|nr:transaldolase [Actinomycetota bacterium]